MIKHILYDKGDKKDFITVTTRRANYSTIYFGKFTFWGSKENFDKGDCHDAIEYNNVNLGDCKEYLPIEADKFIENIKNNRIKFYPIKHNKGDL